MFYLLHTHLLIIDIGNYHCTILCNKTSQGSPTTMATLSISCRSLSLKAMVFYHSLTHSTHTHSLTPHTLTHSTHTTHTLTHSHSLTLTHTLTHTHSLTPTLSPLSLFSVSLSSLSPPSLFLSLTHIHITNLHLGEQG